jgi:hypothetical protein
VDRIIGSVCMHMEENRGRAGVANVEWKWMTLTSPANEGPETLGGNRLALRRLVRRAGLASDE